VIRVLLATPDAELTNGSTTLLREASDLEVTSSAVNASEVLDALTGDEVDLDVIVLHEDLGPLPVLDLARDLNHRFPQVGVVLLSADPSVELLRAAMSAGIRSVTRLPLSFAELSAAIIDANEWSQAVRDQLAVVGHQRRSERARGRMIGIAGSKGGVGTTTVAVQTALELQRRDPDRRVCLVDLDLQTGDVRSYLDLSHRRSITDLIEVATELTTGHLTDAMFTHPTGLRVLLPPANGEDGEDLDGSTAARLLGGIRSRFDTVVVDLGAVSSIASVTAVELADEIVVVCTPDVVSLRGANRTVGMWRRLHARDGGVRALLNRANRDREVQPGLATRVVNVPFLETVLPDRPADLEQATNTGVPERLDGPLRRSLEKLASELHTPAAASDAEPPRPDDRAGREQDLEARVAAGERGSIAAEFVGVLVPVGFVLLAAWQFILAGYTVVLANRAADDGARVLAIEGRDQDAIESAAASNLHGHWRRNLEVGRVADDADEVEVAIAVPMLMPGVRSPWTITTSAGAVIEGHAPLDTVTTTPTWEVSV
jgi:pilus assembly protein CpaE